MRKTDISLPERGVPTTDANPWKRSSNPRALDNLATPNNSQITMERKAIKAAEKNIGHKLKMFYGGSGQLVLQWSKWKICKIKKNIHFSH